MNSPQQRKALNIYFFPNRLNMAKLLFSLRDVPEDEAVEVRELLESHQLDFYETSAGNWGVSMPALWLNNNDDYPQARQLLDEYQQQRVLNQRTKYQALKQQGLEQSFLKHVIANPIRFFAYLTVICLILYASAKIVFEFGL
jgi:hypothetical protein